MKNSLLIGDIPLIAVGFVGKTPIDVILDAKNRGLDIAELRIDRYESFELNDVISEIKKFNSLNTIATIRLKNEGGKWDKSEEQRLALFKGVIPLVDIVDIELRADISPAVIREAHNNNKLALISFHDFNQTPSLKNLQSIVDEAHSKKADIIKVAVHVNNMKDLRALAELILVNKDKHLLVIAMGSNGLISRIFFPALGSCITFAYIGTQTAPGQLKFEDMFELLRKFYPAFNQKKINELEILEIV